MATDKLSMSLDDIIQSDKHTGARRPNTDLRHHLNESRHNGYRLNSNYSQDGSRMATYARNAALYACIAAKKAYAKDQEDGTTLTISVPVDNRGRSRSRSRGRWENNNFHGRARSRSRTPGPMYHSRSGTLGPQGYNQRARSRSRTPGPHGYNKRGRSHSRTPGPNFYKRARSRSRTPGPYNPMRGSRSGTPGPNWNNRSRSRSRTPGPYFNNNGYQGRSYTPGRGCAFCVQCGSGQIAVENNHYYRPRSMSRGRAMSQPRDFNNGYQKSGISPFRRVGGLI